VSMRDNLKDCKKWVLGLGHGTESAYPDAV
jgi:hypothetical protein